MDRCRIQQWKVVLCAPNMDEMKAPSLTSSCVYQVFVWKLLNHLLKGDTMIYIKIETVMSTFT